MVWDRLEISIESVKGMRCKWRGDDPFVVRLVHMLVKKRNVKCSVHPVDTVVGEEQEPANVLVCVISSEMAGVLTMGH